jgi:hypothetical protein
MDARALAVAAALMALAGCKGVDGRDLEDIVVQAAWLEDVELRTLSILGGSVGGAGTLVIETPDDELIETRLRLRGGSLGLGLELFPWMVPVFQAPLRLPDDGEITGDMLVGQFTGNSESISVIGGIEARHLRNRHKVRIDAPLVAMGVGLMISYDWLALDPVRTVLPGDELLGDTGDTGVFP